MTKQQPITPEAELEAWLKSASEWQHQQGHWAHDTAEPSRLLAPGERFMSSKDSRHLILTDTED